MRQTGTLFDLVSPGNTEGGSITVQLTSCLACLDKSVFQIKMKIVSCHTADSKPVKQEVNSTVILPSLVFHGLADRLPLPHPRGKWWVNNNKK
jgi:hypothetical protein